VFLRSVPRKQEPPSPAQLQELYDAFNAWKNKFKANIVDMGGKLKPGGRILTASGVTDGPFAEAKEVVGGYMVVAADNYDGAIEIARECRNGVYAHVQAGYAAYPNSCGGGPCSGAV
jgi:hypothetical protein